MKPLFAFALLVCMFFSMSGFTVVKPPVKKAVKVSKTVPAWPVTGTRSGYTYAIYGNGNVPSYIGFSKNGSSYGPFTFSGSNGFYTASIPSGQTPSPTITAVTMGVYANQEGYVLTFYPDL
jgi:hypothetical protein